MHFCYTLSEISNENNERKRENDNEVNSKKRPLYKVKDNYILHENFTLLYFGIFFRRKNKIEVQVHFFSKI